MKKFAWFGLILFVLFARPSLAVLAYVPTQASSCTMASPSSDPAVGSTPTVCLSIQADLHASGEAFAVSWLSSTPETGAVQVMEDSSIPDVRDPTFTGRTHYATLAIPQPNVSYQFDIAAGNHTYDNNGSHWSLAGPALPSPTRDPIQARVKNPDGSDATEVIVYVTILRANSAGRSALLSQVITSETPLGIFTINLGYARTADFSKRFSYNKDTDMVIITAVGPSGSASVTVPMSTPRPGKPTLTLTLGAGIGTAVTATPSRIPPTSTPTPRVPTLTPTLPSAEATEAAATQTAALTATWTEAATATRARPTATEANLPTELPTDTLVPITIEPAAQTEIAQASGESTDEPSPELTRLAPRVITSPASNSAARGLTLGGSIFNLLALMAFIGAALLGAAAYFLSKR